MSDPNSQPYNYYNFEPLKIEETKTTTVTTDESMQGKLRRFLPIILIVLGLILLGVLAYLIFRPQTPTTTTDITDPNKSVVLQWWGAFLDPEVIQPLLDKYKTVAPNVTIEYANKWPDLAFTQAESKYKTEVNRVLKANDVVQLPDIFMLNNHWIGDYEKYLYTSPSTILSYSEFQNTYYPSVVSDFGASSKVYGLPLWIDTLAIAFNKDMLAAQAVSTPPGDWSQFRSLAQKLTKKSGSNIIQAGFSGGTSKNVTYSFELANILMLQNGVALVDSKGQPSFASSSDSLTSINFLNDFSSGSSATWSSNFKNDAAEFLDEDLAMLAVTTYRLRDILKYNEGYDIGINIGVSALPQLDGQGEPIINWGDYWGNVVTLNRPNKDYAWEFLKWLNEPDQLKSLSTNIKNNEGYFGILYPRKDMAAETETDEYLKIFTASLPYIKTWYMVNGTAVKAAYYEELGSNSANQTNITTFQKDIIAIIANKGKLE